MTTTENTILTLVRDLKVGDVIAFNNHFLTVESAKQIEVGKRNWEVTYFSQTAGRNVAILGGSDSVHVIA